MPLTTEDLLRLAAFVDYCGYINVRISQYHGIVGINPYILFRGITSKKIAMYLHNLLEELRPVKARLQKPHHSKKRWVLQINGPIIRAIMPHIGKYIIRQDEVSLLMDVCNISILQKFSSPPGKPGRKPYSVDDLERIKTIKKRLMDISGQ